MPKSPYRIFIWDTQNKNSGSFLSIPYLELFGSQRIQCDRLDLLLQTGITQQQSQ